MVIVVIKKILRGSFPWLFALLASRKRAILNVLIERQKKSLLTKVQDSHRDNPECQEIISFLQRNPAEMIPYFYCKEYSVVESDVTLDQVSDLFVVKVNGCDVYFPKEMTPAYIAESVKVALIEQDERSPHRYLPVGSSSIYGDAAILCGASDGIYALRIIEHFRKIYLFEPNPVWQKPVKKTLQRYQDKIEVVPFFVSDHNSATTITLDSFFAGKEDKVDYIQADIEGSELKMLKGANRLLTRMDSIKLSLCCYHTANQQTELTNLLVSQGLTVQHSKGFLLMWMEYPLRPPYLRRGVLYAERKIL
jgi:Methyltransferase FkbM domain